MPRISTYTSDTTVEGTDKLLGSNAGGATKNFAVQDISKFFKNTNAAGIAAQFVYKFKTDTAQHRATTGTMVGTFSNGSTFAGNPLAMSVGTVSYTHLTLPTICSV